MSSIVSPNIWYFPSAFGDIRLEQAEGSIETRVIWYNLTPREAEALEKLREGSTHWRRKWAKKEDWNRLGREAYKVGDRKEHHVILRADLKHVGTLLNKALNPDRRTLHVMRIGQGKIEEVREDVFALPDSEDKSRAKAIEDAEEKERREREEEERKRAEKKAYIEAERKRRADEEAKRKEIASKTKSAAEKERKYKEEQARKAKELEESTSPARKEPKAIAKKKKAPAKVVTVKEPIRGCPEPDFAAIQRRATRVLKAFLTPKQVRDFERYNRFIVRGADTGHQYMVTSRNAPSELARHGARSVFDLTTGEALCVHDWDVPAEEEMLSLAMLLQLPKRESWVRALPDAHLRHRHG